MDAAVLISGFTLGAAGSLHCIGMCGPLSLALPTQALSPGKKTTALLAYNAGRITTYSLLGLAVGMIGSGFDMIGLQQQFSILSGIILLLLVIFYIAGRSHFRWKWMSGFYSYLQQQSSRLLSTLTSIKGFYVFGIINGLLPCGMIYIALASAAAMREPGYSVIFMTMFGLATLPLMMAFNFFSLRIRGKTGGLIRRLTPYFVAGVAVLLILRGLNLGIPFVSPASGAATGAAVHCVSV